jgi:hypothetical protein
VGGSSSSGAGVVLLAAVAGRVWLAGGQAEAVRVLVVGAAGQVVLLLLLVVGLAGGVVVVVSTAGGAMGAAVAAAVVVVVGAALVVLQEPPAVTAGNSFVVVAMPTLPGPKFSLESGCAAVGVPACVGVVPCLLLRSAAHRAGGPSIVRSDAVTVLVSGGVLSALPGQQAQCVLMVWDGDVEIESILRKGLWLAAGGRVQHLLVCARGLSGPTLCVFVTHHMHAWLCVYVAV